MKFNKLFLGMIVFSVLLSGFALGFNTSNMVIFFPLNETSGVDAVNYGNSGLNGTIVGTTNAEFQSDGSGLYLKGTASFPNMFKLTPSESGELDTPSGEDKSVSFVIEVNDSSYAVDPRIISWRDGGDSNIYYDESTDKFCVAYLDRGMCSTSTFVEGDKLHFVFTFDNSANTGKIYINGTLDATSTGFDQDYTHAPTHFYIGHRDFDRPFNGTISNVRSWTSYLLDSSEVVEIFNTDLNISGGGSSPSVNNTGDVVINLTFDGVVNNDTTGRVWSTQGSISLATGDECLWYDCANMTATSGDFLNSTVDFSIGNNSILSFWINPTSGATGGSSQAYYQFDDGLLYAEEGDYGLSTKWDFEGGQLNFNLGSGDETPVGQYTHYCQVIENGTVLTYMNGVVLDNRSTPSGNINLTLNSAIDVGRGVFGIDHIGYMDEFVFINGTSDSFSCVDEYELKRTGTPPDLDIVVSNLTINAGLEYKYNFSSVYNDFNLSGTIPYAIELSNFGVSSATGDFNVSTYVDGVMICDTRMNLTAQGIYTIYCNISKELGYRTGYVVVDSYNEVSEDLESNNRYNLFIDWTNWLPTPDDLNGDYGAYITNSSNRLSYTVTNFEADDFNPSWTVSDIDPRGKKGFENAISCFTNDYDQGVYTYCDRAINHLDGWLSLTGWDGGDVQAMHQFSFVAKTYKLMLPNLTQSQAENYSKDLTRIHNEIFGKSNVRPDLDENKSRLDNGDFGTGMGAVAFFVMGDDVDNPSLYWSNPADYFGVDTFSAWNSRVERSHSAQDCPEGVLYCSYQNQFNSEYLAMQDFSWGDPYSLVSTYNSEICSRAVYYINNFLEFENPFIGKSGALSRWATFGDAYYDVAIGDTDVIGASMLDFYATACDNETVKRGVVTLREAIYDGDTYNQNRVPAQRFYSFYPLRNYTVFNSSEMQYFFGSYDSPVWDDLYLNRFANSLEKSLSLQFRGGDNGDFGHPYAHFDIYGFYEGVEFLGFPQVAYNDDVRTETHTNTLSFSNDTSTTGYTSTCQAILNQYYGASNNLDMGLYPFTDDDFMSSACQGLQYGKFVGLNARVLTNVMTQPYDVSTEQQKRLNFLLDDVLIDVWLVNASGLNTYSNYNSISDEVTGMLSGNTVSLSNGSIYWNISLLSNTTPVSVYGGTTSIVPNGEKTSSNPVASFYNRYFHTWNTTGQEVIILSHQFYNVSSNQLVASISSDGDYGVSIDNGSVTTFVYFDTDKNGSISARNFSTDAEILAIDVNGTGTYLVSSASFVTEESNILYSGSVDSFIGTYNASVFNDTSNPTWDELPVNFSLYDNNSVLIDYNASDNVAIDSYYLNDTSVFNINSSGHFYNITSLTIGTYPVLISVNDTNGNINSTAITVTVLNSTIPNATYTVSFTSYDLYNDSLSGVSYSSNDYFVLLFADSINTTAFTSLGLTVTTLNNTLFRLSSSGTYDVQRAKIMNVLFKGSDGSDARIKSDYINGLYKIASSDSRDTGKKGYYAKAVVTYTGGRSTNTPANAIVNVTFSDTSTNIDNSFWRELYLINNNNIGLTTTSKLIISSSEVGSISRTSFGAGNTNDSNFNTDVPEYDNPSYSTRIEVYGGEDSDGDYSGGYAETVFLSSGTVSFTESSSGGFVSTNYSVYDMPVFEYAFNVTGGSAELYIGNYTVLASKSGYYSLTKSFEVTSNSNVNVTGFYNNLANVSLEIAVYGGTPSTNITAVINNADYTYSTSSSNGTFLIPTIQDNYSITFSGSQYATISYNLSTTGGNYTNHSYLVYSLNSINVTIYNGTTTDLLDQLVTVLTVSNLSSFSNTTSTGSLFIDLLEPNDYELRFVSSGYNPQSVFLTVTNESTQSVSVYMTENITSEILRVRVTNLQGGEVEGALVKLQKEVSDGDSLYYTVDEKETNTEGYTAFYVTKSLTDYYRFIVSYEGEVKLTTVETFFVPNVDEVITLAIDTSGATGVNIDNLGVSTSLINSGSNNNTYTFTWADADNEITGARMVVTIQDLNFTSFAPDTLYDSGVISGFTGTLNYTLPFVNDTKYVVKTYIVYRSYSQPYNSVPVIFGETVTPDRNTGLLLASVVFVIVVLLALTLGPLASGVLGLIALGGLSLMGLVTIPVSVITSLIAFLFIVFIKVKGDGNA